ncbi:hypothetical protein GUA87_09390 [Sneathiella sp. P13V-1]|uniref:hypothetical protein n=1 Tax=Sneathiella sp. P13V-1 TaxID=2697366 RepID=UPI00187B2A1F|nr:hypothetical protein [Sneathiella sp. P13V-1]MBE7637056.1 hypothetical protein [Sneathiella sp. P13V-1]
MEFEQEVQNILEEASGEFQEDKMPSGDPVPDLRKALDEKNEEANALREERDQLKRMSEIKMGLFEAGGNYSLLSPHLEKVTSVRNIDGEAVVCVVGPDQEPLRNREGGLLTVADKIQEMRQTPEMAAAFMSAPSRGAGVKTTSFRSPLKPLSAFDQAALNSNIEDIARGKIEVSR